MSLFSPPSAEVSIPAAWTMDHAAVCQRAPRPETVVGAVIHDPLAHVEAELERVIAELDEAMVAAMKAGDRDGAEEYRQRMYAAMASRSPEHQHRLNVRAWQRMLDNDPCYFSSAGERDRERLERRNA